jgi:hypothetical protein
MVRFTPRPLYPGGNNPWYPLNVRLGGSQSPSGREGKEKESQPLPGIELNLCVITCAIDTVLLIIHHTSTQFLISSIVATKHFLYPSLYNPKSKMFLLRAVATASLNNQPT